ncbi:MAG: response regulator [Planctomycetes bacterium]|nr:response regulator [Planctomycetota bacterium]NOG55348.1 response regulator [Planctomycetota bacterium]
MGDKQRLRLVVVNEVIGQNTPEWDALARHFDLLSVSPDRLASAVSPAAKGEPTPPTLILGDPQTWQNPAATPGTARDDYGAILDAMTEGVCLCDTDGSLLWGNPHYLSMPEIVRRRVERGCADAARYYSQQAPESLPRGKKLEFQAGEDGFYEMIVSPIMPAAQPDAHADTATPGIAKLTAIVWDNSYGQRLQQKLDAIDRAGSELVRIEAEAVSSLNAAQRLKLLEDKIIKYSRDLMHFDHFNVFLLDRKTKRLQPLMLVGMPSKVATYELFASTTGNGICGYVAATGKSYICHDVQNDSRYLAGLDKAASSLSVPLRLQSQLIGVFNVESRRPGSFSEDDRQFAEIFGRYIALALNILDLLIVERCTTSGTVAVNVIGEISQPLTDIALEADRLQQTLADNPDALRHVERIINLVETVKQNAQEAAKGPRGILGIQEAMESSEIDPLLEHKRVLVADDEPNILETIDKVLTARGCRVTICSNGSAAIEALEAAGDDQYGLVLSDISMSDRNGYEVFAAAKEVDPKLPVILMTGFGYDPHHSIVRASQEGLQCVLFKPFQVEHLLEEVSKALVERKTPPSSGKAGDGNTSAS